LPTASPMTSLWQRSKEAFNLESPSIQSHWRGALKQARVSLRGR
jgi:hypothetical protein